MFSDDTELFCLMSSSQKCDELQRDLDNVMKWSIMWQLPLNLDKCSVMPLGSNNAFYHYSACNVLIKQTVFELDLGIQIDNQLKFCKHTATVLRMCKSVVAIIKRSFIYPNRKMVTMLCKALLQAVLEYSNCIWEPSYLGDKVAVENLQKKE